MTEKEDKKEDSKNEFYVGAVIEINQKPINLIPSTPINKIKERGLKLSLDKPLELGEFGKAVVSIGKDLGIEENENPLSPESLKKIESPLLKRVAEKVASAEMRIEALKYEQPPVKYGPDKKELPADQQDPTKYVFVASVNWKDKTDDQNENKPSDFFKLKGLIVGVSSGFTNGETGDNPEVQNAFISALQAMTPVAALAPATDKSAESQNGSTESTESPQKTPQNK